MSAQDVLDTSITIALALLTLAFLLTIFRIVKGPTLPDRVLGLDMLVAAAIGYIAVIGIKTGYSLYVDIAIALGLVGFLATVAFARFILVRGEEDEGSSKTDEKSEQSPQIEDSDSSEIADAKTEQKIVASASKDNHANEKGGEI